MNDNKWVIFGESGEYSDYRVEVIAVYDTEAEAAQACDDLIPAIDEWGRRRRAYRDSLPSDTRLIGLVLREWEAAHPQPAPLMDDYTVAAVPYNSVFARKEP